MLFTLILLAALTFIASEVIAENVQEQISLVDYLGLAWLTASMAVVGGALGSGLEDSDAVRKAAYGKRQLERLAARDHKQNSTGR